MIHFPQGNPQVANQHLPVLSYESGHIGAVLSIMHRISESFVFLEKLWMPATRHVFILYEVLFLRSNGKPQNIFASLKHVLLKSLPSKD
jgi:hypothetical protein